MYVKGKIICLTFQHAWRMEGWEKENQHSVCACVCGCGCVCAHTHMHEQHMCGMELARMLFPVVLDSLNFDFVVK